MRLRLITFCSLVPLLSALQIHPEVNLHSLSNNNEVIIEFKPFKFTSSFSMFLDRITDRHLQKQSPYNGLQEYSSATSDKVKLKKSIKRQMIMDILKRYSQRSQMEIIEYLGATSTAFRSFWINNSLLVRGVTGDFLNFVVLVAKRESSEGRDNIRAITPNRIIAKIPPLHLQPQQVNLTSHVKGMWNLKSINIPPVWQYTKGENVIVANIDTGVDYQHEYLRASYRGTAADNISEATHEYNWYDPMGMLASPVDLHGHGTHTMGTIVGHKVGIAPSAKWIAAQGCDEKGCSQERLLASAEWIMCPTNLGGMDAKCELGADIVNNSWGGAITNEESMTWFLAAAEAWIAADVWPIFAQGNEGPKCGTAGTPGDLLNVIGVGSVDSNNSLSVFSSRGPGGRHAGHSTFKPDFVAPGQSILSCKVGGGVMEMSGTSMAAPHIAGGAALLLSHSAGNLTFPVFRRILRGTVVTGCLGRPVGEEVCGGRRWDEFPNYHYGHGLVDFYAALQQSRDKIK